MLFLENIDIIVRGAYTKDGTHSPFAFQSINISSIFS